MKINTKKTKVLVCSRNNNIKAIIHLQDNQEIEHVEEFTYLGSTISEGGRNKKEMIKRIFHDKIVLNKKECFFSQ